MCAAMTPTTTTELDQMVGELLAQKTGLLVSPLMNESDVAEVEGSPFDL